MVRVIRAGADNRNEAQRVPGAQVERYRLAARRSECVSNHPAFEGWWLFDDTKRKRSRRVVKLQDFVLKALTGLRNLQPLATDTGCQVEHDLIFRSGTGSPLRQRNVKREFRRLLEVAGIRPIRLYDLRHTAATLAVAAGVSVKVISDQLGHASISFTLERYSHVLPSIQDEPDARVERMLMGSLPDASKNVLSVAVEQAAP